MRIIIIALLMVGCGAVSPTSSTPETPRQVYIYEYTQCLGGWTGIGEIRVTFHEELDGAAGQAWVPDHVKYHVLSVENGPEWYLEALAAHEVAHLTGAGEAEATRLEGQWPQECGC